MGRLSERALAAERSPRFGDFNFVVATGCCGVDGREDDIDIPSYARPLRGAENDERDAAADQVLLVADVLVGREEDIVAGALGFAERRSRACPIRRP